MSRRRRESFAGASYLVTNRGTAQTMIFRSDDDRRGFLALLGRFAPEFGVDVNAYVLMGNHYHLLTTCREPRLSEAMQVLGGVHARRFNAVHGRKGALFQGRYDVRLLRDERAVRAAAAYIHHNPVRAGLAASAAAYRWSSARAHERGRSALRWLSTPSAANTGLRPPAPHAPEGDLDTWLDNAIAEAAFQASDSAVAVRFACTTDELYVVAPGRRNVVRLAGVAHALKSTGMPAEMVAERYGLTSRHSAYTALRRLRSHAEADDELARIVRDLGLAS